MIQIYFLGKRSQTELMVIYQMVVSDEKDEKEKKTMSVTKVQRLFLKTSFSGFLIIVGETI